MVGELESSKTACASSVGWVEAIAVGIDLFADAVPVEEESLGTLLALAVDGPAAVDIGYCTLAQKFGGEAGGLD